MAKDAQPSVLPAMIPGVAANKGLMAFELAKVNGMMDCPNTHGFTPATYNTIPVAGKEASNNMETIVSLRPAPAGWLMVTPATLRGEVFHW